MNAIEQLTRKIHRAIDEITSLRTENRQLQSELELLRSEAKKAQVIFRANEELKKDHEKIRVRLEKINKKIEKHLLAEEPITFALEGALNEQSR